jgi:hypothetical protein
MLRQALFVVFYTASTVGNILLHPLILVSGAQDGKGLAASADPSAAWRRSRLIVDLSDLDVRHRARDPRLTI